MSDRVAHCPFLNRADSRCSNHFSLDKLGSTFDHCFGDYKACATYGEILDERRHRSDAETTTETMVQVSFPQSSGYATMSKLIRPEPAHVNIPYVPIRSRSAHATIA